MRHIAKILRALRDYDVVSAGDLAKELSLPNQFCSSYLTKLIKSGIVTPAGKRAVGRSGGRPFTVYRIERDKLAAELQRREIT